jgi:hypothetical protein
MTTGLETACLNQRTDKSAAGESHCPDAAQKTRQQDLACDVPHASRPPAKAETSEPMIGQHQPSSTKAARRYLYPSRHVETQASLTPKQPPFSEIYLSASFPPPSHLASAYHTLTPTPLTAPSIQPALRQHAVTRARHVQYTVPKRTRIRCLPKAAGRQAEGRNRNRNRNRKLHCTALHCAVLRVRVTEHRITYTHSHARQSHVLAKVRWVQLFGGASSWCGVSAAKCNVTRSCTYTTYI